jgi:tRNA A37 methylthiotransferase MiaB
MNVNDSEVVLSVLTDAGYTLTQAVEEADVILLNTCAIREKAEARVWQRLAYFRSLRRPGVTRGARVEKGRALRASISTLQHAVDAAQAQLAAARADLAAQQTMHEDALAQLRDAHAAELEEVDAKVRKALQGRDDKIRQLADQVIRAERAQPQAEQMLAEINAGITATRRPTNGRQ